jgi:hypothetical protein
LGSTQTRRDEAFLVEVSSQTGDITFVLRDATALRTVL